MPVKSALGGKKKSRIQDQPVVVVQTFNPSECTQDSLSLRSASLHKELQNSQGYIVRPCLKKPPTKKTKLKNKKQK